MGKRQIGRAALVLVAQGHGAHLGDLVITGVTGDGSTLGRFTCEVGR